MGFGSRHYKGKYSWMKHIDFILIDLLSLVVSFCIAYFLKFRDLGFVDSYSWRSVIVVSCLLDLIIILFNGSFSGIFRRKGGEELITSINLAFQNLVFCAVALYVLKRGSDYSRTVILLMYIIYALISFDLRSLWKTILRRGMAKVPLSTQKSIFVVGEKASMPQLLRSINSGFFMEYSVKGVCVIDGELGDSVYGTIDVIDTSGKVKEKVLEFQNATTVDGIADYVLDNNIDEVFIGVRPAAVDSAIYKKLVDNGKGIHLQIEPMIGFNIDDQFITTVGTYKAVGIGMYSFSVQQLVYLGVKRLLDIFAGLVGLVCMLPLMLVVKISYLLTGDTKPIFYTHRRVGLNGKVFNMVKFRSMVSNADEILKELLKDPKYKEEWDKNQKFDNDPRITKMGRILRRTSLDEIPQFLNILKGDMSLIGPRPLVEGELEAHNGLKLYNQVKPGLTGWWGCNGRSNTTYDERLELEYYYVKNCSMRLDTLCVLKTIGSILKKDGAK